jgi:hypothetical protein
MHLSYYHAHCYLNREYIPFLSPPNWNLVDVPYDGPLYDVGFEPSRFWFKSAHEGVTSARSISAFFNEIIERDLAPWAYPFSGICIMTACTFHLALSICPWNSLACQELLNKQSKVVRSLRLQPFYLYYIKYNYTEYLPSTRCSDIASYIRLPAKDMFARDILNMIKLQETWPLAAHWVR